MYWGGLHRRDVCAMQQCCNTPIRARTRVCSHVEEFRRTPSNKEAFTHVMRLVKGLEHNIQRTEVPPPSCQGCTSAGMLVSSAPPFAGRLHVCLHCAFVGCWEHNHQQQHMVNTPGHVFAVCIHHSMLYCSLCADYVYDPEFDLAGQCPVTFTSSSVLCICVCQTANGC